MKQKSPRSHAIKIFTECFFTKCGAGNITEHFCRVIACFYDVLDTSSNSIQAPGNQACKQYLF